MLDFQSQARCNLCPTRVLSSSSDLGDLPVEEMGEEDSVCSGACHLGLRAEDEILSDLAPDDQWASRHASLPLPTSRCGTSCHSINPSRDNSIVLTFVHLFQRFFSSKLMWQREGRHTIRSYIDFLFGQRQMPQWADRVINHELKRSVINETLCLISQPWSPGLRRLWNNSGDIFPHLSLFHSKVKLGTTRSRIFQALI